LGGNAAAETALLAGFCAGKYRKMRGMMAKIYQIAFELAGKLGPNFHSTFLSAQKQIASVDGRIKKMAANQGKISRFEGLKRELLATERQFSAAQAKVRALAIEIKAAESPTKAMERSFARAKTEAGKLKEKLNDQRIGLERVRREMAAAGLATHNLAGHQRRLAAEMSKLREQKAAYTALQASAEKFRASTVSAFKGVAAAAGAATAAVSGYYAAAMGLANVVMEKAAQARLAGARLGIGVEAYQELGYAARMTGLDMETLEKSLKFMVVNLAKAKAGAGPAAQVLGELGLSAQKLSSMAPDQALMRLAEYMARMEDPAARARLAVGLFGRDGLKMLPFLKQGQAGLQNLREEARRLGLVLSEETVRQAGEYGKMKKRFAAVWEGTKLTVGSALLPALTGGMDEVMKLVMANQADVQAFARQFAGGLKASIPHVMAFIRGAKDVAAAIVGTVKGLAFAVGGFDNLARVIGAVIALKAGTALYGMGKSIVLMGVDVVKLVGHLRTVAAAGLVTQARMKIVAAATRIWAAAQGVLNAVMAANPIALAVIAAVALGAAAYWVIRNWDRVKAWLAPFIDAVTAGWGIVKAAMAGDWEGVVAAVASFVDKVKNLFMPFFDWISEKWNAVKSAFAATPATGNTPGADQALQLPGHAAGGIFYKEHIARFAEGDRPEAVIPLDGSVRAFNLWRRAGQMLGAAQLPSASGFSRGDLAPGLPPGRGYGPVVLTNNPVFYIYGGQNVQAQVEAGLSSSVGSLLRQLENLKSNEERLSYA